jgi:hypothetical protein
MSSDKYSSESEPTQIICDISQQHGSVPMGAVWWKCFAALHVPTIAQLNVNMIEESNNTRTQLFFDNTDSFHHPTTILGKQVMFKMSQDVRRVVVNIEHMIQDNTLTLQWTEWEQEF